MDQNTTSEIVEYAHIKHDDKHRKDKMLSMQYQHNAAYVCMEHGVCLNYMLDAKINYDLNTDYLFRYKIQIKQYYGETLVT